MEFAFAFHGVPEGHDIYGGGSDRYYESFYGGIDRACKGARATLIVEIRKDTIGYCSYYSYVRSQNVVARSGRNGSYFGMSLKVKGFYCTDVFSLFRLFDKIYSEKILGTIIELKGKSEQYRIANFSDSENLLRSIIQIVNNQITTSFANDFDEIDSTFTKPSASSLVYYNLEDVNCESFFNSTKVSGKVFVSPEYASKDSEIVSLRGQLDKLQKEKGTFIKQQKEEQVAAKSLKSDRDLLEQRLKDSKVELEQIRVNNSSNIVLVANRLEPTLTELSTILKGIKYSNDKNKPSLEKKHKEHLRKRRVQLFYYGTYLVLILLVILFLLLFIINKNKLQAIQKEKEDLENRELYIHSPSSSNIEQDDNTEKSMLQEFSNYSNQNIISTDTSANKRE